MHIQVNTDHNIDGHEGLVAHVTSEVEHSLSRFSDHITRVEVHLSDENSDKKGGKDAMRCVMEVRLEGHQPVAITHQATTLDHAISGAVNKLARLTESSIGRLADQRGHRADPPPSGLDVTEDKCDTL